jgi:hypothetical protein
VVIPPTGRLHINASPWAEVWVDDEYAGETPLGNVQVNEGTHRIRFRHPTLGERTITTTVEANRVRHVFPAPFAAASGAGVQELLDPARVLYDAAAFESALATLDRMAPVDDAGRAAVQQYRALCLAALGRDRQAHQAIAEMIAADPLMPTHMDDVSPRFRAMVMAAWPQLLRSIVRARYAHGTSLYQAGAWREAAAEFSSVLALLDHPSVSLRREAVFADVRQLASDYLALARPRAAGDVTAAP